MVIVGERGDDCDNGQTEHVVNGRNDAGLRLGSRDKIDPNKLYYGRDKGFQITCWNE
jgi:hypothetical protein